MLSTDGSGKGASLVAAVAYKHYLEENRAKAKKQKEQQNVNEQ